jgi:hypothetical protein
LGKAKEAIDIIAELYHKREVSVYKATSSAVKD